jgi:hypothetical protein
MRANWLGSYVEYRLTKRWGEVTATMADPDALLPAGGYFFSFR